jgi:hypothetical protein
MFSYLQMPKGQTFSVVLYAEQDTGSDDGAFFVLRFTGETGCVCCWITCCAVSSRAGAVLEPMREPATNLTPLRVLPLLRAA